MDGSMIYLKPHEIVVAVIPEGYLYDGVIEQCITVYVHDREKDTYRREVILPNQQTTTMQSLFPILEETHKQMFNEVSKLCITSA